MPGRCKSWVGLFEGLNKGQPMAQRTCACGVHYMALARATRPTEPEWNQRLPCWGRAGSQVQPCALYSPMSEQELAALRVKLRKMTASIPEMIARMSEAFRGAGTAEGGAECPVCGDRLLWFFTRDAQGRESSSGQCRAQGCVQWTT